MKGKNVRVSVTEHYDLLIGEIDDPAHPQTDPFGRETGVRMQAELLLARENDLPVVLNLSRYYIYDMSEFMGWPCPEDGVLGGCDEYFTDWSANRNTPYIIRMDGELAGFTGVVYRETEQANVVQEFLILRKFRRQGVGRQVAVELFERYPGNWVVEQLIENLPAVEFWRTVVNEYTGGQYAEAQYIAEWGEMNVLRFRNSVNEAKR